MSGWIELVLTVYFEDNLSKIILIQPSTVDIGGRMHLIISNEKIWTWGSHRFWSSKVRTMMNIENLLYRPKSFQTKSTHLIDGIQISGWGQNRAPNHDHSGKGSLGWQGFSLARGHQVNGPRTTKISFRSHHC